jgi:hypothetical protein
MRHSECDGSARVRWDEVESLVNGRPYVGGFGVGFLRLTRPLVNLYVSKDRLVLQLRFGLARLYRPWVVDRAEGAMPPYCVPWDSSSTSYSNS